MKTNAIVRIILWSLILIFLVCTIVWMVGRYFLMYHEPPRAVQEQVTFHHPIDSGEQLISDDVRDISINWVSGSITIEPGDVSQLVISESGGQRAPFVSTQYDNHLQIDFCENDLSFNTLSKDLKITVPRDYCCRWLIVSSASGSLKVQNLTVDDVIISGASGKSHFDSCHVKNLNLNTASGDLHFSGTLETLECYAASASVYAVLDNVPDSISVEGMSGKLDLTLPEDAGFSASMDSLTGKFQSEFSTVSHDGIHVCGDGRCSISMEGVSGNVILRKGKTHHDENSAQSPLHQEAGHQEEAHHGSDHD